MLAGIFTVSKTDFERLSALEAVEFFRALLWAEARHLKLPTHQVKVSSLINVPDGGIDASLESTDPPPSSGIFLAARTGYQIKASEAFHPQREGEIKKELFGKNKRVRRENLGESIRNILDAGGAYVLVCFKQDLVESQRLKAVRLLRELLVKCGYEDPRIAVWGQTEIVGFLQLFPSLLLRLNGREHLIFQTHESWANQADMRAKVKLGPEQSKLIANIREELGRDDEAVHVHVWGEAGIGKTRLILEATSSSDIRPLVLYCNAAKFIESDLVNELLRSDNNYTVILVVDECDTDSRTLIWNKFKHVGPRIKIITIYNEYRSASGVIRFFDVPPLGLSEVSRIIQEYDVPPEHANRYAEMCSGSPRVAHVVGWNLKNNPADILKPLDTVNIWERYIVGGDDPNSPEVRQRRLVLQYVALFKRFGFERAVMAEAQTIAAKVKADDPQVTWARFQQIVQELRARKILQGAYSLYITPKLLHVKLWADWWDTYGRSFNLQDFSADLPPKMLEWFYEMFEYAAHSEAAPGIVRELLGSGGPFENDEYLKTRLGARFFLALTNADPGAAVNCLRKTIGTWNRDELFNFKEGRREVVHALERIAVWGDLFIDAARLLLWLGEAENETYANNASGVFAELFSLGYGQVAPTEAPPQRRFAVLQEALTSPSKEQRKLALRACDVALETDHHSRVAGAEYQGLRQEPKLWVPKTWGEIYDAYRQAWQLLYQQLDNLPLEEQMEAARILIAHSGGVGSIPTLADMVLNDLHDLAAKTYVDKEFLLKVVIGTLRYGKKELPPEVIPRWEILKEQLTGNDFPALLKRYVGMDLLEDKFDDEGKYVDQKQSKIEELAQQAVDDNDLLQKELPWLVNAQTENAFIFGRELGMRDNSLSLLPMIINAHRDIPYTSANTLGGYLNRLFQIYEAGWEQIMDVIAQDDRLSALIPELTWRSRGITERAAERITRLLGAGKIRAFQLHFFLYGNVAPQVPEHIFTQWIEHLLASSEDQIISLALDLFHTYYLNEGHKGHLPEDLTLRLLTHPSMYRATERGRNVQMEEFHWTLIAKAFVRLYPERSLELAATMIEHFGTEGTIFYRFHSSVHEVLSLIAEQHPRDIWQLVTKYIGESIDSRSYRIMEWLKRELSIIPSEEVFRWVDEDVEKRARFIARFVPKVWPKKPDQINWAREVLVRYGNREDVRGILEANFSGVSGWGDISTHFENKRDEVLSYKEGETDPNVLRWIDDFVANLNSYIEGAKVSEERRF